MNENEETIQYYDQAAPYDKPVKKKKKFACEAPKEPTHTSLMVS